MAAKGEKSPPKRQETLDYGSEDPPSYQDSYQSPKWSCPKRLAIAGFVVLQLMIVGSILNQLFENYNVSIVPEQIHLSLGKNDREYIASWSTMGPAACQLVWKKHKSTISNQVSGKLKIALFEEDEGDTEKLFFNEVTFSEKTFEKYFYTARMAVTPGNSYSYHVSCTTEKVDRCSSEVNFLSETYRFDAVPLENHERPIKFLFYGDLGLLNAQSVPRLLDEVLNYNNDMIIHNGDFAYDLDTERGEYGDKFMRLMEPIAARIPYQTSVGNHEMPRNFSHYDSRFNMINRGPIDNGHANNFYYSFDAGPVHFIAISTEFYYYLPYSGLSPLVNQYEWLRADLEAASQPSARAKRPWIVVYGHRPMYCSSNDKDDCTKDNNLLRRGLPFTGLYALEKLFYEYGVDVELYSHEHQYERFLPIYDGQVYAGQDKPDDPYFNPRAPVHLISGSAGCEENLDRFVDHKKTGSVKQISDYGYTRIQASRCKIEFEQVSDDRAGMVVDKFTISKDRQSFPPNSETKLSYVCAN